MPKPKYLLALFTPLIILFAFDSARACSCSLYPSGTAQEKVTAARDDATAVFFGHLSKDVTPAGEENTASFRFQVIRAWKGVRSTAVVVSTTLIGGACGFPFQTNANYLVYAYGLDEAHLGTNRCTRTNPAGADTVDFLFLGKPEFERTEPPQVELVKNQGRLSSIPAELRGRLIQRLEQFVEYDRGHEYAKQFELLSTSYHEQFRYTRDSYVEFRRKATRGTLLELKLSKPGLYLDKRYVTIPATAKMQARDGGVLDVDWLIYASLQDGEWYIYYAWIDI